MTLHRLIARPLVPLVGDLKGGALPWENAAAGGLFFLDLLTGGTFTRSTEGSYLTAAPTDGTAAFLAWAGVNARRIEDRGDGLGPGLLMEGSRTNNVIQSRALETGWTSTLTITADAGPGPDGTTAASRAAGTASKNTFRTIAGVAGVLSAWGRATTGTVSWQITSYDGAAALTSVGQAGVTTTYRRLDVARVASLTTPIPADGFDRTANGGIGAHAEDALVDLVQAEAGYFPTSAIRTTTIAVTRGADVLSYASGSYPIGFLTSGFRVIVAPDASSAEIVSSATDLRVLHVGSAGDFVRIRNNAGSCVVDLVCGGVVKGTLTVTFSRAQALTITAKPTAGTLTVSGATTGNGTNTVAGAAWASAQTLYVGADNAGANPFFGRIFSAVAA